MADNNKDQGGQQGNQDQQRKGDSSIGNQQGTAQTGGQNAGGTQREDKDDSFSDDLRNSGNRKSRDDDGGTLGNP